MMIGLAAICGRNIPPNIVYLMMSYTIILVTIKTVIEKDW